jgi:hypothetical protein
MRAALPLIVLALGACGGGQRPASTGAVSRVAWLAGSWTGEKGAVVEHWNAAEETLIGVGFGVVSGKTRSYEIMTITPGRRDKLVFAARPQGRAPVVFPEEDSGDDWVVFANPQHGDPQRIAYRVRGDRLVAHTEGRGNYQDWLLERRTSARAGALERAAAAGGDRPITSALSPAGDLGFTLSRSRLIVWRLAAPGGAWQVVNDLPLR